MRVLVAPDSFKGSISAADAAAAIAAGWRTRRPADEVVELPLADGGEGTLDAIRAARPGSVLHALDVTGPDGRTVAASWLEIPSPEGSIAVVEFAATSGITLLDRPLPLDAQSTGFGEAVADALDHGCRVLLLTLGGSGSSDGGQGILTALGARLLDAGGEPIAPGNRGLDALDRIDVSGLRRPPAGTEVIVLSDVTNPLLGPEGAIAVFGEQKGVTASVATAAEANLARYARMLGDVLPVDPATPGAGAAGGAGFGLLAWGASLVSGARHVGEVIGLPAAVSGVSLVITGEGRYDAQSEGGKATGSLRALAAGLGVPCALVAGQIAGASGSGAFVDQVSLTDAAGSSEAALREPARWLTTAGERLADRFGAG
ncbi:glycerate kinase [Herbiconiux solani]|uniref:glycerate kinase n=1 Tax=Herbiconiux solani TaxID=661329 RepID=UPI0008257C8E|nr:glycerate kinase [Herbiconiux solani]